GTERRGNVASGYPALLDIGSRRSREFITSIIKNGKGMMPSFPKFDEKELTALTGFLFGDEEKELELAKEPGLATKSQKDNKISYSISGYSKFLDKNGLPAVGLPWGTLNAIDLNTGDYIWK